MSLVLIGAFFIVIGSDLNILVRRANDNFMPVATMWDEIFFVIGTKEQLGNVELSNFDSADGVHRNMTSTDKLSFLSDRILIIPNETSASFENMCTNVRLTKLCPLSTTPRMASIGDLMIWMGLPFLLCSFLVLLAGILSRLRDLCLHKTTRK